ncbi:DNA damage-binding protein 1a-like [Gastrolobium bilobum]|uniref:DNA damage-binding protein 1a-like n=1 Tax=Gastrolobium bilobum TaxID=150636 RepID=UPI002AB2C258|nr:DNA damage-binding protein 1a-like [Gastrolobium bilobum]
MEKKIWILTLSLSPKSKVTSICILGLRSSKFWISNFFMGCSKPTIVVLYQDNKDARHVKTYEVALKDKDFVEGPWSQNNLDNGADLLIPVPPPLCGVLIIGEETIVYCSASAFKAIPIRPSSTKAYGRVDPDGSRYLLGDYTGLLSLLVISHEKEKYAITHSLVSMLA